MEQTETFWRPKTNIEYAWLQLCKLRSILHWAHIGVWSVNDSISTKIGPVNAKENNNDNEEFNNNIDISFDKGDLQNQYILC